MVERGTVCGWGIFGFYLPSPTAEVERINQDYVAEGGH
jgi:hypothetical protein